MSERDNIRELIKYYADNLAFAERSRKIEERYKDLNDLKIVRPPVLIFEIPWGEIKSDELKVENESFRGTEYSLRSQIFQHKYFGGDHCYAPYWSVGVRINNTGNGFSVKEKQIPSTTGAYIAAHEYIDQIQSEEDVEKMKMPEISYDKEATDKAVYDTRELLGDIMPVRKTGVGLYFTSWDDFMRLHGIENCYEDLVERPEFIHAVMQKYTDIHNHAIDEYERLNVLETEIYYLHCTPALCHDMPHKDLDTETVKASDVWCRTSAQVLAVVSPAMQREFDIDYSKTYANRCKRTYYGCCEPLHNKIDQLKDITNLRRVSITPWANVDEAAEKMGKDFIMSYKPNPAFVSGKTFEPEQVEKEITHVLEACKRNSTPCEFVLKDISTIANRWENLMEWNKTVNKVIDRYFG